MKNVKIGLLSKERGNFRLQKKFAGQNNVVDETSKEVEHHRLSLLEAGYDVSVINWDSQIMSNLKNTDVNLIFNVSSMAEAAILEDLEIPYVGSDVFTIAQATSKSLGKLVWQTNGIPTSPFHVATSEKDCEIFKSSDAPFPYPLFAKPDAGRGSAGITSDSVIHSYNGLVNVVNNIYSTIGQPVLLEKFLQGREITFGVVGTGKDARALPPLEIKYATGDVTLTFDKKEKDNDSFYCPAPLSKSETLRMQELAVKAYNALGFKDYGRIDMILTEDGPFILEGNTFAGLMCTPFEKPHSYIGFMSVAEGNTGKELLDEIVQSAVKRYHL